MVANGQCHSKSDIVLHVDVEIEMYVLASMLVNMCVQKCEIICVNKCKLVHVKMCK